MPGHPRKLASSTTAHPLFPAVVALWLGALFGLASLAVRPALLEALAVRSGIDRAIPAAAAPLGITARLLLALALAALGSLLGALIARRLAPPVARPPERKRHLGESLAEPEAQRDEPEGEGSILVQRKRPLTLPGSETPPVFVPTEFAPLPGAPQVLDICAVNLEVEAETAPLDLAPFAPAVTAQALPMPDTPETAATAAGPDAEDITDLATRLTASMARRRAAQADADRPIPARLPLMAGETVLPEQPAALPAAPSLALSPMVSMPAVIDEIAPLDDDLPPPQYFAGAQLETAEPEALKPVVTFPGQMATQPQLVDAAASFRCFDAPDTAGQGKPIAAGGAEPNVDPAEAAHALRMALASLQRMSGAA